MADDLTPGPEPGRLPLPVELEDFRLEVPEADLDDLRSRLRVARWPEPATVGGWTQGVPLEVLRELCRHWAEDYDWRVVEARVNALAQVRAVVDGLGLHVLHVRSPHADALPLVVTHGWPGSVVEFLDVIGPLTDPTAHGGDAGDAFHVVCPTLPGYGWSDKPAGPGWGVERTARAWASVMAALGYRRYGAQGGDWGSAVTSALGVLDPAHVAGIHLNLVMGIGPPRHRTPPWTEEEADALAATERYRREESGYALEQATRPQTLGYGLVDSPTGLAGWILEKFWAWSDAGDDPVGTFGADRLLDDVMWYWLPAVGASSARLYWESWRHRDQTPVQVPTGVSTFPRDLACPPREWVAQRFRDLRYWGTPEAGGHFAAFERPDLYLDEVRAFFRLVR